MIERRERCDCLGEKIDPISKSCIVTPSRKNVILKRPLKQQRSVKEANNRLHHFKKRHNRLRDAGQEESRVKIERGLRRKVGCNGSRKGRVC